MTYDKKIQQIDWALALALKNLPYIPIELAYSVPYDIDIDESIGLEIITGKTVGFNLN